MNRLKLIAHKWYVAFLTIQNVLSYIFKATERIAGLKIVILTEQDLDDLDNELAHEGDEDIDPKDLN